MKNYQIVNIDAVQIKYAADSYQPFTLRLGNEMLSIQVKPNPVWSATCQQVRPEGTPKQTPCGTDVQTYSGRVLLDGVVTKVRLVIGKDSIRGFIYDGKKWLFIEPLQEFRPNAQPTQYLVYYARDLKARIDLRNDTVAAPRSQAQRQSQPTSLPLQPKLPYEYEPDDDPCYVPGNPKCHQSSSSPPPPPPTYTQINVHLVADQEFVASAGGAGSTVFAQHALLVSSLNTIFHSVNVNFNLASSSVDSSTSPCFTAATAPSLVLQVAPCFAAINPSIALTPPDVVHLTSGKVLPNFLGAGIYGMAQQPGTFGFSTWRLNVVGGSSVGSFPDFSFLNLAIAAHEIGHNFDGCHAEADHSCTYFDLFGWCAGGGSNTIMYPTASGDTELYFSFGTVDSNHNNAARISFNESMRPGGMITRVCPF